MTANNVHHPEFFKCGQKNHEQYHIFATKKRFHWRQSSTQDEKMSVSISIDKK